MTIAASFIEEHRATLGLDRFGPMEGWTSIQVTPRYRTSAHVIFLLVEPETAVPQLVLKVARFPHGDTALVREAENLRTAHAARPTGFDSIPQVLSCAEFNGTRVLLETGLTGRIMTRKVVRREFEQCRDAVVAWVTDLHTATRAPSVDPRDDGYAAHAVGPLAAVEQMLPDEVELIDRTRDLLAPLRGHPLPTVFEHGDLSAPNLLLDEQGGLQVVDWELAAARGLPGCDLFFALNYLGSAMDGDRGSTPTGFARAFLGPDAWGTPLVRDYGAALALEPEVTRALFFLCWVRYVAGLADRLPSGMVGRSGTESRRWLKQNRYFRIWSAAIHRSDEVLAGIGSPETP